MSERIELTEDLSGSPLYNEDIAPTKLEKRTWSVWHIAALWIGMAVCIPTYMLGASLLKSGMTWWQAVLTIALGNVIVLVPMALNSHAGAKYGIPFPVFLRAPFGVLGANVPAMMRAAVACGWFGIQTWIGGKACYLLAAVMMPSIAEAAPIGFLGINAWQLVFFLLFWAVNVYFIVNGTESIKWLETWAAPFLIVVGLGLLGWGIFAGGGMGRVLGYSTAFKQQSVAAWSADGRVNVRVQPVVVDGTPRADRARVAASKDALASAPWTALDAVVLDGAAEKVWVEVGHSSDEKLSATIEAPVAKDAPTGTGVPFWLIFFPSLTAMVGYWATLALNIPDFTRFAKSQKDQMMGQAIGLPPTMGLYAFIGIAVTCASLVVFKDVLITEQAPWDPVDLLKRFQSPMLVIASMFFLVIATLTTNIAANVVGPANDLASLAPKYISFKTGGMITAFIGIVMMPWKLVERPDVYIFTWLIGYGALLGPIAGIMIADYWIVRRQQLALADLYRAEGRYGRWNLATIVILVLAILPNVPGFLATVGVGGVPPFFSTLFTYAWFVGFAIAFALHSAYGRMKAAPAPAPQVAS